MDQILIKPLITEKMTDESELRNRYGFIVDINSNKIEIRKAVERNYSVSVLSVHTMNYDGKAKTRFTKAGMVSGRSKSYKKAIVQLQEGDAIDFYENI